MPDRTRTVSRARTLRTDATDAEQQLWHHLRNRQLAGYKFRRQSPVGIHIADFLCQQARLVIELDGGQHSPEADAARTAAIEAAGYRIIRFWNHDVLTNIEGVTAEIRAALAIAANASPPD